MQLFKQIVWIKRVCVCRLSPITNNQLIITKGKNPIGKYYFSWYNSVGFVTCNKRQTFTLLWEPLASYHVKVHWDVLSFLFGSVFSLLWFSVSARLTNVCWKWLRTPPSWSSTRRPSRSSSRWGCSLRSFRQKAFWIFFLNSTFYLVMIFIDI